MNDDVTDIAAFYDREAEREDSRLDRHMLEWDLTRRYLFRYLPAGCSILEIGASTGRYTLELAARGHAITAVDLSTGALGINHQRIEAAGLGERVRFFAGDARNLGDEMGWNFDAVLFMGPLYHLVAAEDRIAALRQAYQRLHPGGLIFSAFISRFGILGDLIRNVPGWIEEQEEVRSVLDKGRDPEDYPRGGFRGYFARVEEIPTLLESAGFDVLLLAAVEPAISADDEAYNRLEGRQRGLWLDLLEEVSTEKSILAASRHLLCIGRKPA